MELAQVERPEAGKLDCTDLSLRKITNKPFQYQDKTTKTLMMLPTDMAIIKDKAMRPFVEKYAKDNEAFFKDFSNVLLKLFELGVPFEESTEQSRMTFKPTHAS